MTVFDSTPFYPPLPSSHRKINTPSRPAPPPDPLKFRGIEDSLAKQHLEGSECCLIHADNYLSKEKGVWLNPNVRVAYNATTYSAVNHGVEVRADIGDQVDGVNGKKGDGRPWPGKTEKWKGVWSNRFARWSGWITIWSEGKVVRGRIEKWVREGKAVKAGAGMIGVGSLKGLNVGERKENAADCLVNEMQVMFENGWQHV